MQTANDVTTLANSTDGQIDESYTLDVSHAGAVTIQAASSVGIAHALTSFTQLWFSSSNGAVYTTLAPVHIVDSPQFAHRGLNMDVARSYYPLAAIERTIDALAYNKMNHLHLHITDSQSWPLEITSMPDLAAKGAYAPNLVYSAADVRSLQRYGSQLGVEVYLEIDMPGHIGSVHYAYPDLIAAANVQPNWSTYSAEPPSGQFKLNSSAVYTFLGDMWNDLLPRVSQWSSYFHTGMLSTQVSSALANNFRRRRIQLQRLRARQHGQQLRSSSDSPATAKVHGQQPCSHQSCRLNPCSLGGNAAKLQDQPGQRYCCANLAE